MVITQFNDVFYKWGLLFTRSFVYTNPNKNLYLDTVNLSGEQIDELKKVSPGAFIKNTIINFDPGINIPTYMANRRVKVFLEAMKSVDDDQYLMSDADMLFRSSIDPLYQKVEEADVAIIFRDGVWEGKVYEHLKVACGLVLVTKWGLELVEEWDRVMKSEKALYGYKAWEWWWDQVSLLEATRRIKEVRYSSIEPGMYINRDFDPAAIIWSANKPPKDLMYSKFSLELERMKKDGPTNRPEGQTGESIQPKG